MKKVLRFLYNLDKYLGIIIVACIFFDVCLQVISRLAPGNSIPWTVEAGEMLLGALIWLGLSAGVTDNSHIILDLVVKKLPRRPKKAFGIISNLMFMVYMFALAYFVYGLLLHYLRIDSKSVILELSLFVVRLPIFIGCIASIIKLTIKQYRVIAGKEEMFVDSIDDLVEED